VDRLPTVFVVDDDVGVRETLRQLAQSVGLAADTYPNAAVFLENLDTARPGCLVLDVRLPGMSGLDLQKELAARGVQLPVVMMTAYPDVAVAVEAMKAGAFDFLEKPFAAQRLLDSVQAAIAYDSTLRRQQARHREVQGRLAQLSPREREVMDLVAEGRTSSAIASHLGLRTKTVEVYRSHINRKMQARNVADLIRMVREAEQARAESEPNSAPLRRAVRVASEV
jgi:two-component system response regulator FixJ